MKLLLIISSLLISSPILAAESVVNVKLLEDIKNPATGQILLTKGSVIKAVIHKDK